MADQRLHAAEALGQRHQPHAVQKRARLLERPERKGNQPAEPSHLPLREFVLRMIGQARVVHQRHLGVRRQERGDALGVGVVALHADGQRLGAAQHQPRVHRPQDGALGVLHELQPLGVLVAHAHHDAAHAVAVAVQELGGAVQHEVGAELDRPLRVGAGERVVHHHGDAAVVGHRDTAARSVMRSTGLVGVSTKSIFVLGLKAARGGVEVRRVHVAEVQPALAQHALEQPVGAAVGVVGHHHVVAGLQQRRHGPGGRQPGRKRERRLAALHGGDVALERRARGVLRAPVLVPLVNPEASCT